MRWPALVLVGLGRFCVVALSCHHPVAPGGPRMVHYSLCGAVPSVITSPELVADDPRDHSHAFFNHRIVRIGAAH